MIQWRALLIFSGLSLISSHLWAQDLEPLELERRKNECIFKAQYWGYPLKAREDACSNPELLKQRNFWGDYPLEPIEDFIKNSCRQEMLQVREQYNLHFTEQSDPVFRHILSTMYYCEISFYDVNRVTVTRKVSEIMKSSGKSLEDIRAEDLRYHQLIREQFLNSPKDSAEYQLAEALIAQSLKTCESRLDFNQRAKLTEDGFILSEPLTEQQVDINSETCQVEFIEFLEGTRERLTYAGE